MRNTKMKNLQITVNVCQLSKTLSGRFAAKPGDSLFILNTEIVVSLHLDLTKGIVVSLHTSLTKGIAVSLHTDHTKGIVVSLHTDHSKGIVVSPQTDRTERVVVSLHTDLAWELQYPAVYAQIVLRELQLLQIVFTKNLSKISQRRQKAPQGSPIHQKSVVLWLFANAREI